MPSEGEQREQHGERGADYGGESTHEHKGKVGVQSADQCADLLVRLRVAKVSDGRIPWPMCKAGKRARAFILTGDLERAVRRESNQAVAYSPPLGFRRTTAIPNGNAEGGRNHGGV
jgi:hypothetical protein